MAVLSRLLVLPALLFQVPFHKDGTALFKAIGAVVGSLAKNRQLQKVRCLMVTSIAGTVASVYGDVEIADGGPSSGGFQLWRDADSSE